MKAEGEGREEVFEGGEVASATECTGLMPTLPRDEAQDASSAALYAIHRARGRSVKPSRES